MEDDIQLPVLTPSAMMFGPSKLRHLDENLDDGDPDTCVVVNKFCGVVGLGSILSR